jgi:hypothetical protein
MQVYASRQRDWRARCARLAAMGALWAGLAAAANAAAFDEKLAAPAVRDAAGVQAQARSFAARLEQAKQQAPERVITDRALFRERAELSWHVQESINSGQVPEGLPDIGLERRDDGSYVVDVARHPEWADAVNWLAGVLPHEDWPRLAGALTQLGMRPDELAKLERYLRDNDPRRAASQATLHLSIGFARVVKKLDRLRRPVPDSLVMSFLYQRALASGEARRAWLDGLLVALGAHGSRILQSYYEEAAMQLIWLPDDRAAGIAGVLADLRRPDFEALATREAQGGAP